MRRCQALCCRHLTYDWRASRETFFSSPFQSTIITWFFSRRPMNLRYAIPNGQALRASVAKYKALFEDATAKLAAFEGTEVVAVDRNGGSGSGSGGGGGGGSGAVSGAGGQADGVEGVGMNTIRVKVGRAVQGLSRCPLPLLLNGAMVEEKNKVFINVLCSSCQKSKSTKKRSTLVRM